MTDDYAAAAEPATGDPAEPAAGELGTAPFDGPDWQQNARRRVRTSPDQVRRRVHGRSRRKRRILLGAGVFALVVLASAAWLAYTALKARTELQAVRSEVHTLRSEIAAGDLDAARATATSLRAHAARAHDLTTGPVWATAAAIPYFGDPLDTARVLSSSVHSVATDALPSLIDASTSLEARTLRKPDGSFDLAPIERVAPLLGRAITALQGSVDDVSGSSGSTWIGSVNTARADLLHQLPPLLKTVRNADVAARTVPPLLGSTGPKSYFVSFQNEAELRGTGGLPGAFGILRADHGRITFTRFESDTALLGIPSGLDFGFAYNQTYSGISDSTIDYLDSNVSLHFPYAAQIWAAQWFKKSGQHLDGALALDPTTLSYLLAVTGPARLPDGSVVSAANVVRLTQQTAYDRFGNDNDARKQYLLDVAKAASEALIGTKADPTALVKAAARAVSEHRMMVWTKDPAIEQALATTPVAGTVPITPKPYVGLAINNNGGNKLDYYLHAALDWQPTSCGSTRQVTVTLTLRNEAPKHLKSYVLGLTGRPGHPQTPGVNRSMIQVLGTESGKLTSATINGAPAPVRTTYEQARPVYGLTTDLPVGETRIVYHLIEPAVGAGLITRMQPMINPVRFTQHPAPCGP